jgi:hypothetical protein
MAKDPWHYPRTALADQYLKTLASDSARAWCSLPSGGWGKRNFSVRTCCRRRKGRVYHHLRVPVGVQRGPQIGIARCHPKGRGGRGCYSRHMAPVGLARIKRCQSPRGYIGAQASWDRGRQRPATACWISGSG